MIPKELSSYAGLEDCLVIGARSQGQLRVCIFPGGLKSPGDDLISIFKYIYFELQEDTCSIHTSFVNDHL